MLSTGPMLSVMQAGNPTYQVTSRVRPEAFERWLTPEIELCLRYLLTGLSPPTRSKHPWTHPADHPPLAKTQWRWRGPRPSRGFAQSVCLHLRLEPRHVVAENDQIVLDPTAVPDVIA